MFERVLLPLDGSDIAETALPYAEELSRRLGSELVLYHVHGREHADQGHMHLVYLEKTADAVRSKGRKLGAEPRVSVRLEAGEAIASICNLVETNGVDLIVMTAVSSSGLSVGKMLGSVADQVCRTVPVPALLIRPKSVAQDTKDGDKVKHMVLPLDGSDLSKQAFPIGEELALKLKLDVTLFQMAKMFRQYEDVPEVAVPIDYAKLDRIEHDAIKIELDGLEEGMRKKGLAVTAVITSGTDAASEIIRLCKVVSAELVVMSTHGRSGLGRWALGSVAEKVMRQGDTPLLLVHSRAS